MKQPRKYLNHLDIKDPVIGKERQYEFQKDALQNGTFLPRTVDYEDIDSAFKMWAENSLKISYNDKILPTMVLYSNQRFSEYSQTWKYVDENKNLILNFKTITRENNPQYGKIQGGLWNIPGNRFYIMKKQIVLDDNGSESLLVLKMRQPMAIDFMYNVSIFTTNFETINEFNRLVNDRFKARQDYISPKGYYMPMTLENISDKSSYQIDDRQFYSQSFEIKVMGYVLTEEDFRVDEQPLKLGANFRAGIISSKKASIEVEEYVNPCNAPAEKENYYPKQVYINIEFPPCENKTTFTFDENVIIDDIKTDGIKNYHLYINGEEIYSFNGVKISDGDDISIKITPLRAGYSSTIVLSCNSTDIAYSYEDDEPEIDADMAQYAEIVNVTETETENDG